MLKKLILGAAVAGMMATPALATTWYPGGGLMTPPSQGYHYRGPIGPNSGNAITVSRAFYGSLPYQHHYVRRGYSYRGY